MLYRSFILERVGTKDPERTRKSDGIQPPLASTVHTYNRFLYILRIDVVSSIQWVLVCIATSVCSSAMPVIAQLVT